jgi:hypothetical protein
LTGKFVTQAPSGSFEARIVEPSPGEICVGRATADF